LGTEGTLSLAGGLKFYPQSAVEDNRWIVESWPRSMEEAYYKDPKVQESELPGIQRPKLVGQVEEYGQTGLDTTVLHLGNWIDSIRTRQSHWEDAAAGHHAAACAHMVNLSAKKHRMVEWDFTKDDIKG
jgi:hypothetical protein